MITDTEILHNRRNLHRLIDHNVIVEMRGLPIGGGAPISGYFDNFDDLRANLLAIPEGYNVYTSLNLPKDTRATNVMAAASRGGLLSDTDIGWITRLPFDFDPVRPKGVCSTSQELIASNAAHHALVGFLQSRGWPEPLRGDSGNGHHVQYRVKLPNNDETRALLKDIYTGLKPRFSTDAVEFDTTVRNPSRIFRLYGSWNRKGESTEERPHRRSGCYVPQHWACVSRRQIEALADSVRPVAEKVRAEVKQQSRPTGSGDYRTLDIKSWFHSQGLYKRHLIGGKHAVTCPWHQQHSSPDDPLGTGTVIWESTGSYPTFHCSHAHCEDRDLFTAIKELSGADDYCAKKFGGAS